MRINPRCDLLIGNRPENDSDNQYLECEDCHRYEICKKHGCVEMCSSEEIKVAIPSVLEPSYDLLTKEGYFEMSMISEQVKELRDCVRRWQNFESVSSSEPFKLLSQAADTIESLSAKLQAANKEIEALNIIREIGDEVTADLRWTYCGDGENLPTEPFSCIVTVLDTEPMTQTDYEVILPYHVGYDGKQWNDIEGNQIPFDVIAWQPLPEPYHEP